MKKKIIIIISAILLIVLGIVGIASMGIKINPNRLKSSIDESDITGSVSISCSSNTLSVNEETTCTLTGTLNDNVTSVAGKIEATSGLEISNVEKASNWQGDSNTPVILYYSEPQSGSSFSIATFKVKGLSTGSGTIKFTKIVSTSGDVTNASLGYETNYGTLNITEPTYGITVSSSSTPDDPTPDDPTPDDPTPDDPTPLSSNAYLSTMTVMLPPIGSNKITFNKNTLVYNITYTDYNLVNNQYAIEISATPEDSNARVSGTGSFNWTGNSRSFNVVVTAQDGTKKTYTINATKQSTPAKDSNAYLQNLTVSKGTLIPSFSKTKYDYSVTVPSDTTSVVVTATRESSKATVSGAGTITLDQDVKTVDITVVAEDGTDRTYSITFTKEGQIDPSKDSDNTLKSITVTNQTLVPAFSSIVKNYTITTKTKLDSIDISLATNSTKATVTGGGHITLNEGVNVVSIVVTAENGSKNTYTIRIYNGVENDSDTDSKSCNMILSSYIYKVDNEKMTINAVDKNHNDASILNNLTADCGTITVSGDKVVLTYEGRIKEYKINRVFFAQTGNKVILYSAIIGGLLIGIGVLIFVLIKMNKDKK